MTTLFDPTEPSYLDNPYPALNRLRRAHPVYWWETFSAWLVTDHELCRQVLNDPVSYRTDPVHLQGPEELRAEEAKRRLDLLGGATRLVSTDRPDHERLRGVVAEAFARRPLDDLRPSIEHHLGSLLDNVTPGEPFDLVSRLAKPLPLLAIAEQLGVSPEDQPLIIGGAQRVLAALNPLNPVTTVRSGHRSIAAISAYLDRVADGSVTPRGGQVLLSMVEAERAGHLSRAELLALTVDLATAGNQALAMAIGTGTLSLISHRAQMDHLRADPSLVRSAIDELLRYETPTQALPWITTGDVELGGVTIPANAKVYVLAGAANRDPAVFPDPDRLDLGRQARRHLAFGTGIHGCLGAALARRELELFFTAFLQRFASVKLSTRTIEYDSGFMHRGLKALPVVVG